MKADIDNGYTRIANELTAALMQNNAKLSGREFQIVHAIINKTFGFQKKDDWITNSQLSEMTGISQSKISELKTSLINKKVVILNDKKLAINTTVSDWGVYPNTGKNKTEGFTRKGVTNYPNMGNGLPENGEKLTRKRGTQKKETNTKETNTKEKRMCAGVSVPENLPLEKVKDFYADRKERKEQMTSRAMQMFVNKCLDLQAQGHDISSLIDTAIEKRWKSVFPPQPNYRHNQQPQQANQWSDVI